MPMLSLQITSPLGPLTLIEKEKALVALDWDDAGGFLGTPLLHAVAQQLYQYFAGERRDFDFPIAPVCTLTEQAVFTELRRIPFGSTLGYGDIARRLGAATKDVIAACRSNPIPILIPSHRVIADDGQLGPFEAPQGLEAKSYLLHHEGALPAS